jgi:alkaline phosphatase isozyme conversion protein
VSRRGASAIILLAACLAGAGAGACAGARDATRERPAPVPSPLPSPGAVAFELTRELSQDHPARIAGTAAEAAAADFIAARLKSYGFEPRVDAVQGWTRQGEPVASSNVIAVKIGESDRRIIVGAHYDSVASGQGATDNASGVALLLETAQRLSEAPTPYTIDFVAFGAEEVGWWGSRDYYAETVAGTRGDVVCMVDLDVPAGGDKLYVHSEAGAAGWPREEALRIGRELGVPLRVNPGLNPDFPRGTAGDWSDQRWFRQGGIPYLWFESTNWDLGDKDGYVSTRKAGSIWHTADDTVSFMEKTFPGRLRLQMARVEAVLERFLTETLPPQAATPPVTPAPSPAMPTP